MKPKYTFLLSLTFLFLFSGSSVVFGDDFKDGMDAYKRKDVKEAFRLFRLSAEQGNAGAQAQLSVMYSNGKGVLKDLKEAVKWSRLSAEQGNAVAQFNLGVMYDNGQGVPQDYELAHMWLNLSGSNGYKDAVKNRDIIVTCPPKTDPVVVLGFGSKTC